MPLNPSVFSSPLAFSTALEAEVAALQQFLQLLHAEQDALNEGSIDKLQEISRLKSDQVVALSQLSAGHFPNLRTPDAVKDEVAEFIRKSDSDGRHGLAKSWEMLLDLAKEAHRLNQHNGAMIAAQLKYNQQALAILQEAAKQSTLYGPDGHAQSLGSGRQLGKI